MQHQKEFVGNDSPLAGVAGRLTVGSTVVRCYAAATEISATADLLADPKSGGVTAVRPVVASVPGGRLDTRLVFNSGQAKIQFIVGISMS